MDYWWQSVPVWLVLIGAAALFCTVVGMITVHEGERKLCLNAAWLLATIWTALFAVDGHTDTPGAARVLIVAAISVALRAFLPAFWHDLNRDHRPEKEKVPETPPIRH